MSDRAAVDWLLGSKEPAIRLMTRRDVLGETVDEDTSEVLAGPMVTTLLSGQRSDGSFDGGSWSGLPYRLVSLVELAVPTDEPRAIAAANHVLGRILAKPQHRGRPKVINGLCRVCANYEGTVLVFGSRLGMANDSRIQTIAERLVSWQWPDGGWNCHRSASGRRSSFHESLTAAWGLHEYAQATGDTDAANAADRAGELFLQHRLVYSLGSGLPSRRQPHPPRPGEVINPRWIKLGYPSYWHYDIMAALMFLARIGKVHDPRASDVLDLLQSRRRPDDRWAADRQWWTPPDGPDTQQREAVDWGQPNVPSEMITLNALRVLRAAGRLGSDTGAISYRSATE